MPSIDQQLQLAQQLFATGQQEQALPLLREVLRRDPANAKAHELSAYVLGNRGQPDRAREHLQKACSQPTASAEAHYYLGSMLLGLGQLEPAIDELQQSLRKGGEFFQARHDLGLAYARLGQDQAALAQFERALRLKPDSPELQLNLALLHQHGQRHAEALPHFERAVALDRSRPAVWFALGLTQLALRRPQQAVSAFEHCLALDPAHAQAWSNLGTALQQLDHSEQALSAQERALALKPDYAQAWCGKGVSLNALGHKDDALKAYAQAIAHQPDYAEAWSNQGAVQLELGQFTQAMHAYERALALQPDLADAQWNCALAQLLHGDLLGGFRHYEARWRIEGASPKPVWPQPELGDFEAAVGKRVLIWAEQGFGDTLQFIRYIPLLSALGCDVVLQVQPPLLSLLGGQLPCRVIAVGDPVEGIDAQLPLLSLPRLFGTTLDSIPAALPLLHAPEAALQSWQQRLPPREPGRRRIGLACSGNPQHKNDKQRSLPLELLVGLAEFGQLCLVQTELKPDDAAVLAAHPDIAFHGEALRDFADTAGLVANMDLIISVDTSLVHLAGAMGKPCAVLLAAAPDWRWLLQRQDSPWYPGMRLFRQPSPGDWPSAIAALRQALMQDDKAR